MIYNSDIKPTPWSPTGVRPLVGFNIKGMWNSRQINFWDAVFGWLVAGKLFRLIVN